MKKRIISIATVFMWACAVLYSIANVAVWAQTQSSLQVGTFTLNVPSTNPAVTVNSPAKAGTLALLSDIPVTPPPGATVYAGQIAVNGSATFTGITATPICTLSPRFTTTATGLQVSAIDYVCTAKNN